MSSTCHHWLDWRKRLHLDLLWHSLTHWCQWDQHRPLGFLGGHQVLQPRNRQSMCTLSKFLLLWLWRCQLRGATPIQPSDPPARLRQEYLFHNGINMTIPYLDCIPRNTSDYLAIILQTETSIDWRWSCLNTINVNFSRATPSTVCVHSRVWCHALSLNEPRWMLIISYYMYLIFTVAWLTAKRGRSDSQFMTLTLMWYSVLLPVTATSSRIHLWGTRRW